MKYRVIDYTILTPQIASISHDKYIFDIKLIPP